MKNIFRICALTIALVSGFFSLCLAGGPNTGRSISTNTASTSAQIIDGILLKVDGDFYIIEDQNGKQARLLIGKNTKHLNGIKKPGDLIRAEISKSGQVLSIQ